MWRRTHIGRDPVRSETDNVNVKVVAGVPLPGDAWPFSTVIWPQVPARTGAENATPPSTSQPASPTVATSFERDRWRAEPRITDSVP